MAQNQDFWHGICTIYTIESKFINERENRMIKNTKTVTINKFTFEYIPSMRVLNVTSPTGGIEVHHQLSYEKANEIVGEILEKNRNRS